MRRYLNDQFFLPRAARKVAADLFHIPYPFLPKKIQGAAVVTCHDLWLMEGIKTKPRGLKKYYDRWNLENALHRADHIITVSRSVAAKLLNQWGIDTQRVTCIPPPLPVMEPDTGTILPAKEFILTVGTLEPRKNLERLLIAQASAYKRTQVPLFLVGPYGWRAKQILSQLGRMGQAAKWLGEVRDGTLARLYQKASAVVQYSLDEGFDYTVAEALHFGRPLVLSNIPVHREVAGDLGCYVSPFDPDQLAASIEVVLSWSETKIEEHAAAADRMLTLIRRNGHPERYLEVYKKAVSFKNSDAFW
jgi:glycosyltransferase involved in cell wall biosynthesis